MYVATRARLKAGTNDRRRSSFLLTATFITSEVINEFIFFVLHAHSSMICEKAGEAVKPFNQLTFLFAKL